MVGKLAGDGFGGIGLWRYVMPACGLPYTTRLRRLPGLQLPLPAPPHTAAGRCPRTLRAGWELNRRGRWYLTVATNSAKDGKIE